MEHVKKKKKKPDVAMTGILISIYIMIGIALVVAVTYGYKVYKETMEYKQVSDKYDEIATAVVETPAPDSVSESDLNFEIDFETLKNINPDIRGWIYMEDTPINYPVVWSTDGEWYLKHLFTGEYNNGGCVYIDDRNNSDLTDKNTVFYAHNMKNGTMFAALLGYKDPAFYKDHKEIYYKDVNGSMYKFEPFAGYTTTGDDAYVITEFADDNMFMEYVNQKISSSTFRSDIQITPSDQIVTLSTCSYHTQDGRYALFCKLTKIK